jgi:hypothetical protein
MPMNTSPSSVVCRSGEMLHLLEGTPPLSPYSDAIARHALLLLLRAFVLFPRAIEQSSGSLVP